MKILAKLGKKLTKKSEKFYPAKKFPNLATKSMIFEI